MEKSYKFRNSACDANIHEIQKFWKQYETILYNLSWMNLRQLAQPSSVTYNKAIFQSK